MKESQRRELIADTAQRIGDTRCKGCGGPLTVRMIGHDRLEITVVCEDRRCWPELPERWKAEVAIIGTYREWAKRRQR